MRYNPFVIIAVVLGIIVLVPIYYTIPYGMASEGLAVIFTAFTTIVIVAGLLIKRAYHKPDRFVEQFGQADILSRLWFPLQDELTLVVKARGRVTEAASVWTTAPGLSKRETPLTFFTGMQEYVRQRGLVASLAATDLQVEERRKNLASEQHRLLSMAQGLLEDVNRATSTKPGTETVVRRTRRARPRPSDQRPRIAVTRPGTGTTQTASAFRGAQARTATSTRTIRERSVPSRSRSVPMRIADTAGTSELAVPAPTRREGEPPPASSTPPPLSRPAATPPGITYTTIPSAPIYAHAPVAPEPATPPSVPTGDLRLDIASVCEDLFDPKRMSYETNRLFDDRYKNAMVRWKGTVRRASVYSYDFDFGDGGGTKAELDIYEVKQQYGSRTVKAFVQLPVEAADDIGDRMGEDVQFEGRLLTCEGSARRLYVADARMVD